MELTTACDYCLTQRIQPCEACAIGVRRYNEYNNQRENRRRKELISSANRGVPQVFGVRDPAKR